MSHANESRLETPTGVRHQSGRHLHYSALSQEDRIRAVFGLSAKAQLPSVGDGALVAYYDHLVASLAMPFEALYCPTGTEERQLIHYVRVTELRDPRTSHSRSLHGVLCCVSNSKSTLELPLSELGVRDDNPNCQLIDDYAYWFVNWR